MVISCCVSCYIVGAILKVVRKSLANKKNLIINEIKVLKAREIMLFST